MLGLTLILLQNRNIASVRHTTEHFRLKLGHFELLEVEVPIIVMKHRCFRVLLEAFERNIRARKIHGKTSTITGASVAAAVLLFDDFAPDEPSASLEVSVLAGEKVSLFLPSEESSPAPS